MLRVLAIYFRLLILLVCLMGYQRTMAQNSKVNPDPGIQETFPYIVILPSNSQRPAEIPDSVFYKNARGIIFPVNIYKLPKNDPWFTELRDRVYPWLSKHQLELRYIEMRGASSPEGPIRWNNFLADRRSKSLVQKLQDIFHVDYALVDSTVIGRPEDYKALLYMMEKKKDPDYQLVKEVLDRHNGNRVTQKAELMRIRGGKLWKRLLSEYYPAIRYARVMLYFMPRYMPKPTGIMKRLEEDEIPDSVFQELDSLLLDLQVELVRIPRKHVLAVRTNLIYDFLYFPRYGMAYSPNIQLEYYPKGGRFTFNASLTYPDWEHYDRQKFWQIHDYNLGVRMYTRRNKVTPKDAQRYYYETADYFQGFFVGAYAHAGRYGIGLDENTGWEGEYFGGGLQLGYTLPLCRSSRWRLEFSAGLGVLTSKYDPYIWGNPINGEKDGLYYYEWYHSAELFKKRNHKFFYAGPTELGIHLTYDLLYRRSNKKGVSVNRWNKPTLPMRENVLPLDNVEEDRDALEHNADTLESYVESRNIVMESPKEREERLALTAEWQLEREKR